MAKLSAYNQREVFRATREKSTPEGDLTTWERDTFAVMSNGRILRRLDVRFRPDAYDPKGRLHSYGWKVYGKCKRDVDAVRALFVKRGFTIEGGAA